MHKTLLGIQTSPHSHPKGQVRESGAGFASIAKHKTKTDLLGSGERFTNFPGLFH